MCIRDRFDTAGIARAVAQVQIDQVRGQFAGGRWLFEAVKGKSYASAWLADFVDQAALGASEWSAALGAACCKPGEGQTITVQLARPGKRDAAADDVEVAWECIRVGNDERLDRSDLFSATEGPAKSVQDDRSARIAAGTLLLLSLIHISEPTRPY